ncbi:MAG: hypothetical protein LBU70_09850 [Chitinispirillales bacterium]|jgi:hypothetical protein|nr:hypothetical protein [Chitinispirillales bacterium]
MAFANKKKRALNLVLRNKLLVPSYNITGVKPKREKTVITNIPAYSLNTDIPKKYNDTYIRTIPKDPQNTFVYWEVPKEKAADSGIPNWGNIHADHDKAAWIHERVSTRQSTPDPQPWPIPETRPSPPEVVMPPAPDRHHGNDPRPPETRAWQQDAPKQPEAPVQNFAIDFGQRQETSPSSQSERDDLFISAQTDFAPLAATVSRSSPKHEAILAIPVPSSGIFYNNNANSNIGKTQ